MNKMDKKEEKRRGRPRLLDNWTADLLRERSNEYFKKCDDRHSLAVTKDGVIDIPDPMPYSIEGLCVYLDILRREFDAWRKRQDDLGHRAEMIHQRITANRVEGALCGKQNSSFAQFMLKNTNPDQYREKVEVENTVAEEARSIFESWSAAWKQMQG